MALLASQPDTYTVFTGSRVEQVEANIENGVLVDPKKNNKPFVNFDAIFRLKPEARSQTLSNVFSNAEARRKKETWIQEYQEAKMGLGEESAETNRLRSLYKARMHPLKFDRELKPYQYQDPKQAPLALRLCRGDFVFSHDDFKKTYQAREKLAELPNKKLRDTIDRFNQFKEQPLLLAVKTNDLKLFKKHCRIDNALDNLKNIWNEIKAKPNQKKVLMLEHLLKLLLTDKKEYRKLSESLKVDFGEFFKYLYKHKELRPLGMEFIDTLKNEKYEANWAYFYNIFAINRCSEYMKKLFETMPRSKVHWLPQFLAESNIKDLNLVKPRAGYSAFKLAIEAGETSYSYYPLSVKELSQIIDIAVSTDDQKLFEYILKKLERQVRSDRRDEDKLKPILDHALIMSARYGRTAFVKILLKKIEGIDKEAIKTELERHSRSSPLVEAFDTAAFYGHNDILEMILNHFNDEKLTRLFIIGSEDNRSRLDIPGSVPWVGEGNHYPCLALLYALKEAKISSYEFLLGYLNKADIKTVQRQLNQFMPNILAVAFNVGGYDYQGLPVKSLTKTEVEKLAQFTINYLSHASQKDKNTLVEKLGGSSVYQRDGAIALATVQVLRALNDSDRRVFMEQATCHGEYSPLIGPLAVSRKLAREFITMVPEDLKGRLWYPLSKNLNSLEGTNLLHDEKFLSDQINLISYSPEYALETLQYGDQEPRLMAFAMEEKELYKSLYNEEAKAVRTFLSEKILGHEDEVSKEAHDLLDFFNIDNLCDLGDLVKAEKVAMAVYKKVKSCDLRGDNYKLVMNAFRLNAQNLLKEYSKEFTEQEWAVLTKIGKAYTKIVSALEVALTLENYNRNDAKPIAEQAAFALAGLYEDADEAIDFVFNKSKAYQGHNSKEPIHDVIYKFKPCQDLIAWGKNRWKEKLEAQAVNFADEADIRELIAQAPIIEVLHKELYAKGLTKVFSKMSSDELQALLSSSYRQEFLDQKLAVLCKKLSVPEEDFDEAFMIRQNINDNLAELEKKDQIPELGKKQRMVDGKEYSIIDGVNLGPEYSSYYLRKLDRLDPRILFVGKYTNSCNYIGSGFNAEPVAKAQASSPYAGCYVVAQKADGEMVKPETDLIVAKTSVWKAKSDNLVLNSWESKDSYSEIGLRFAQAAAIDILKNDKSMNRVTLGKNKFGYDIPQVEDPELPIETNTRSSDSFIQFLLAERKGSKVQLAKAGSGDNTRAPISFAMSS